MIGDDALKAGIHVAHLHHVGQERHQLMTLRGERPGAGGVSAVAVEQRRIVDPQHAGARAGRGDDVIEALERLPWAWARRKS